MKARYFKLINTVYYFNPEAFSVCTYELTANGLLYTFLFYTEKAFNQRQESLINDSRVMEWNEETLFAFVADCEKITTGAMTGITPFDFEREIYLINDVYKLKVKRFEETKDGY